MDELEDARKRKLEELQRRHAEIAQESQRQAEADAQISAVLKKFLTEDAMERLGNVRLVNRQLYDAACQAIIYLVQNGLDGKIDGLQVKAILERLSRKRETKITRK